MATMGILSVDNLDFINGGTTFAKLTATANTLTLNGSTGGTTVLVSQVTSPVVGTDAANKAYVDAATQGISWKAAVQTATTGSAIVLGALGDSSQVATTTIDSVSYTIADVGARILVKNQGGLSADIDNGLYQLTLCTNVSFFFWARTPDCAAGSTASGVACFVTKGTVNNDTAWMCPTNDATFGSTAITFVQFSAGGGAAVGPANAVQFSADGLGAFGGITAFTFNQSTSAPDMEVGADATSTSSIFGVGSGSAQTSSTVNVGTGSSSSTAVVNIGTANNATSTINLSQGTGTSTIAGAGTGLMTMSAGGAFTSTAAAASAVSLFNTTTSGVISLGTSQTAASTLTLGNASGVGQLFLNGTTGASTLTIGAAFTATNAVASAVSLFNTNTTGGITTGTGLTSGVYTIGNSTMTGTITVNNAGTINIGANATSSNLLATGTNGVVNVTSGNTTTGTAGNVNVTSGSGGTTGAAGDVVILSGDGGSTSGNAGSVNITAGDTTSGTAGSVKLAAGLGNSVANNGNVRLVTASNATANGTLTTGIIGIYDSTLTLKARVEDNGAFYGLTFNATSDKTHKTNIKRLDNSLKKVNKIRGYSYNWKDSFMPCNKKEQYGVMAQDLEEEGLDFLVDGQEGSKSVNYNGIIALLLESVNELSEKVRKLEGGEEAAPKRVRRLSHRKRMDE